MAGSFALAAPLNAVAHQLYARFESLLMRFQSDQRHPDDTPLSLADADVAVFGMGRVGTGAYAHLLEVGAVPIGLDSDPLKVSRLEEQGQRVLYADAEDPDIWQRLDLTGIRAILLALPDLDSKCVAARELRRSGFRGLMTATCAFADQERRLLEAGVDDTFNPYETAGDTFARRTWGRLEGVTSPAS